MACYLRHRIGLNNMFLINWIGFAMFCTGALWLNIKTKAPLWSFFVTWLIGVGALLFGIALL